MKLTKATKKFIITLTIALAIPFVLNFLSSFNLIEQYISSLENTLYDTSFRWFMDDSYEEANLEEIESRIVFVDIDEASLAKLGPYWQWPRSYHADVVKELSRGGAATVTFDILFKKAFFGKTKTENALQMLKQVLPEISWDSYYDQIKPYYNDDSVFVDEVQKAGNVVIAATVGRTTNYLHNSQWQPLSTPQWADSISSHSAYYTDQKFLINNWDILDNVFPALGHAAKNIGLVNVFPDEDGVHRSEYLLHGFPNPTIDFNYKPGLYPIIALQTALILSGNDISTISIVPGEHIDIGKPLTIYKDSLGVIHSSYPNLTWPMLRELFRKSDAIAEQRSKTNSYSQLTVATQFVLSRNTEGLLSADIFDAQTLTHDMIIAVQNNTEIISLLNTPEGDTQQLSSEVTLQWDDDEELYMLVDSDDNEVYINIYVASIIKENSALISNLNVGAKKHLACNFEFSRHKYTGKIQSNFIMMTESITRDLLRKNIEDIESLKPGEKISIGKNILIPIDEETRMRINFSQLSRNRYVGRSNRGYATISYYDVIAGKIDPGYYQGKIFVLGSSAAALMDIVSASPSNDFPGVLIHLNMLENIINSNFMRTLESHKLLLVMLLFSLAVTFMASYTSPTITFILATIVALALFIYNLDSMLNGTYLSLARPYIVITLSFMITIILRYVFEEREKKQAVEAFKSYISPELIDEMLANDQKPSLGGEENFLTAYFTDIASFSTFSEKIGSPSKLVELLNEYLTAMTNILLDKEGTLDKYEGDAIIAFFGAPVRFENHAQLACEAALEMQRKLGELRELWTSQGEKWPEIVHDMRMRIGINSGQIVTGNMGSAVRMNYTMMGDSVNLAARLESGAKQYGVFTMCSQETLDATDGDILSRAIDVVKVMGKTDPVVTYELLDKKDTAPEDLVILCEKFTQARALYNNTQWAEAEVLFTECLDLEPHHPDRAGGCKTTPSHVYIERCQEYAVNPPVPNGEVWDGVYTATEK